MYIEDLIFELARLRIGTLNNWDHNIVLSFCDQTGRGSAFTEKQSDLAVKILKRYSTTLSARLNSDVSGFLETPKFKLAIRKITNSRRISILPDNTYGKIIKVEFPYDESVIADIRNTKNKLGPAVWNKDLKSWIFALCEANIKFVSDLSLKNEWTIDEEFLNYQNQIAKIQQDVENFVPMVVLENNTPKFKNVHKNLPNFQGVDIIESLFAARKYGITVWSDEIDAVLNQDTTDPLVIEFLKSSVDTGFNINSEKIPFSDISELVKNMLPCMVVIPGGSELNTLLESYDLFHQMGINDSEMSVMFRLPTETGKEFNDFVKKQALNSPISDKTKVVFISSKLPKPVLKSNIKFNCILNLGIGGVHYSIREYLSRHHNLINFSGKSKEMEFAFVIM
jgi:hypothetical protein